MSLLNVLTLEGLTYYHGKIKTHIANAIAAKFDANGKIGTTQLANGAVTSEKIDSSTSQAICPVGTILPFAGSSAPSGNWLLCNGSAVSRTTYAGLFAVIGTAYGTGDGTTTFNLPDFRDKVMQGVGSIVATNHVIAAGLPMPQYDLALRYDSYPSSSPLPEYGSDGDSMYGSSGANEMVHKSSLINITSRGGDIIPIEDTIYKTTNTTVQPPATTCNFIIRY